MISVSAGATISRFEAWALSLGCILGWGAFVMPGTTFLPIAGPAGTAVAMCLGAVLILSIAANFTFMMRRHPDGGGAFSYTRHTFGYDHAFLCVWALGLAYIALLWANATAFTLIARYLFGPVLLWGFHYTIFSYDVYLGEVLFTLAVLLFFGFVSVWGGRIVPRLQAALVCVLLLAVGVCCAFAFVKSGSTPAAFAPAFADGRPESMQIFGIAALVPWAFVGFESISHSTDDLSFPVEKSLPVMAAAIAAGALAYTALTCLATLSVPDGYATWREYIAGLDNLRDITGLPTFHAAQSAMGDAGLALLGVAVAAALSTSMLGFFRAAARLTCAAAEEYLLPAWLARRDAAGTPRNAIYAVMGISLGIPLLGRTVIGWLTDITTITASIAYLYTSACSWVLARRDGNRRIMFTGASGVIISACAFLFPLIASFWGITTISDASYLVLAAWSIIGFSVYNLIIWRDKRDIIGQSMLIFIIMFLFLVFSTGMWAKRVIYFAAIGIKSSP
ncbi:MAG: APC family permease [Desulfovibrio desulfuricans]|jgi:amino acid transporter|nr:APC family permease [Desulfovibrio desulfuricans]